MRQREAASNHPSVIATPTHLSSRGGLQPDVAISYLHPKRHREAAAGGCGDLIQTNNLKTGLKRQTRLVYTGTNHPEFNRYVYGVNLVDEIENPAAAVCIGIVLHKGNLYVSG